MWIEVNSDRYGKCAGTHISVYIHIKWGEYDEDLKWPFTGEITFKLLNQLEKKNHHTAKKEVVLEHGVITDYDGIDDFLPHSALGHNPAKNTQYLKDDTVFQDVGQNS